MIRPLSPRGAGRHENRPAAQRRQKEQDVKSASNTALVGHIDCPGGGQVWVDGHILYIGHMRPPSGTTIVDISDPRNPKKLATLDVPPG